MSTRKEAREYLDGLGLKKAGLAAAARELGISFTSRETAADLRQRIVEFTVGARADAAAISDGVRGASGQRADEAIAAHPARPRRQRGADPVIGRHLDRPLQPNKWGTFATTAAPVNFHEDGVIGTAIARMGEDKHLDVDGQPLADVLGRAATDAVIGRATSQQVLDEIKRLRDRMPEGGAARRELADAVERLDAPESPVPQVPAGVPAPLRNLMADLHAIPLIRRDPRERDALVQICDEFAAGTGGGMRMMMDLRQLRNQRHESTEGKNDIDRAVDRAVDALDQLVKTSGRAAIRPPRS